MPSVSKSQQRLMGVAYAVKSGSMELKDVDSEYRDKVASLVDGMTKKDLKKYASTKHDKLPETVDEAFIGPFVFNDKMSSEELMGMYKGALDGYANYAKGMYYAKSDYKRAYQEIEKILKKRGVAVDETIQQTAITPGMIGGMGNVSLPANGELGSGDFPHTLVQVADIDDDEEKKKQKGTVKNLQAEDLALTFKAFVNEAIDYNDPVLIRLRQAELRRADMAKLDAIKKEAEKNRKKAMKRWNTRSYEKWLEEVASGGGAENAFDMARNAEFEPGLIDWIEKEFPGDDPMQRLQWDIEAFAESVEPITEKKLDRDDMMKFVEKYMDFVRTSEEFNGSEGGIWVSGENMDEFKGQVIYDYYAEGRGYELGVNVKWEKELNKRGWYSEWYDAGTVQIWPI